jgi:hypothetical protein
MKYDQLVNAILQEQYFGGSPNEQTTGIKRHVTFQKEDDQSDNISGDEAKAMQNMLNQSIADRRGGKKKTALQMVNPDKLSDAGKQFLAELDKSADAYKQGSAIGGDASLRQVAVEIEDAAFVKAFGQAQLDYIGWDNSAGFGGAHLYRYPATGAGITGVPHDKDGFRLEASIEGNKDGAPGEVLDLFPLDQFSIVNLFASGSNDPILTKGRITQE